MRRTSWKQKQQFKEKEDTTEESESFDESYNTEQEKLTKEEMKADIVKTKWQNHVEMAILNEK